MQSRILLLVKLWLMLLLFSLRFVVMHRTTAGAVFPAWPRFEARVVAKRGHQRQRVPLFPDEMLQFPVNARVAAAQSAGSGSRRLDRGRRRVSLLLLLMML